MYISRYLEAIICRVLHMHAIDKLRCAVFEVVGKLIERSVIVEVQKGLLLQLKRGAAEISRDGGDRHHQRDEVSDQCRWCHEFMQTNCMSCLALNMDGWLYSTETACKLLHD